jgi:hypothetical protein
MRRAGDGPHGLRTRALIILLWRAGLRISEALSLAESDLDPSRGSILVRHGKGGKRREVGMDHWAWQHVNAWLQVRVARRVGALLCVIDGTQGDHGHQPLCAPPFVTSPPRPKCGRASRHINYVTPMPSRWPAKAFRSTSSNANSDTPTSGSPRSTSKASIAAKSSIPPATAPLQYSQPAPDSTSDPRPERPSRQPQRRLDLRDGASGSHPDHRTPSTSRLPEATCKAGHPAAERDALAAYPVLAITALISSAPNARSVVVRRLPWEESMSNAAASVSSSGASRMATRSWPPSVQVCVLEGDAQLLKTTSRRLISVHGVLELADALLRPIDQHDVGRHGYLLGSCLIDPKPLCPRFKDTGRRLADSDTSGL